ncbi:MAG: hypothetical protein V1802_03275 [Candidatus Aenigmatarchaeota archaeon]
MRYLYNAIFAFVVILFFTSTVNAAFRANVDEFIAVPQGGSRQVELNIFSDISDSFSITIKEEKPWMILDTSNPDVSKDETKKILLFFSPTLSTEISKYQVTVVVQSAITGIKKEIPILVSVVRGDIVDVEKISVVGDMQPTGKARFDIKVKNFRTVSVPNINVHATIYSTYKLLDFTEIIDKLDPGEEKTISREFSFDKYAPPGKYFAEAIVSYGNLEIPKSTQRFEVASKGVIVTETQINNYLIGYSKNIKIKNVGNADEENYVHSEPISSFTSFFYIGGVPTFKTDKTYVWKFDVVKPGDEKIIAYSIDYLPLITLIILLAIAVWYFFFKIKTVRIKKFILQKQIIKEGTEFTVGVEVANNCTTKVENLIIKDFVPSVFKVKDTPGPLPHKKKSEVGTELKWEIKDLIRGEERILTYKLIPVFGVHGRIKLPPASVKFKHLGRTNENKSWVLLGSVPEKEKKEKLD